MTRSRALAAVVIAASLAAGCGLKGEPLTPPPLWGDPNREPQDPPRIDDLRQSDPTTIFNDAPDVDPATIDQDPADDDTNEDADPDADAG